MYTRTLMFEPLEERLALNSAPILMGLPEVIYLTPGTSYHVALNGQDADNDRLNFSVASTSNSLFDAYVLEGNKSVKFSVYQEKTSGKEDWELVGNMIMELFQQEAPITTQRFMDIINGTPIGGNTYTYNGVPIHRIIDGFMIQGGDVQYGNGYGGTGVKFQDEYHDLLQHSSRGIVSTANSGANTNDSQFFITDVATRGLDGKHNVFGFVTKGDDIREQISALPTYGTTYDDIPAEYQYLYDVPICTVKTDNFEIFDDYENGTLRLVVPKNASPGESQVTVYVSDGVNAPVPYTFTVKVINPPTAFPSWNIPGYLDLVSGQPYTFTIPEYPLPGEVEYDVGYLPSDYGDSKIEIIRNGREVTIIPPATGGGLTWIYVHAIVKDMGDSYYDGAYDGYEKVALFIAPSAPQIKLAPLSDTGTLGDNITSRNNDKVGNELIFEVSNVVEGASVRLYRDGYEIPGTFVSQALQDNGLYTLTIRLDAGTNAVLADGTHLFTARQIFTQAEVYGHPAMESPISQQLAVVVDTKGPIFTRPSGQTLFDAKVGEELQVEFTTQNQWIVQTKFTIHSVKNSQGETIAVPNGVTMTENGFFLWTPTAGQVDEYTFEIQATNGSGLSAFMSIEIAFQSGPEYTITGNTTVLEGELIVLELALTDPNYEGEVEFSIQPGSLPDGIHYTLEKTGDHTAVFTWQTTKADGRKEPYNPKFIVTDENGDTRRKDVVLTVNAVETPPYFTNPFESLYQWREYEAFTLQLTAADDDIYFGESNPLTFSLVGTYPVGMTINAQTGLIKWTPGESQGAKRYDITVRVTDKTSLYEEKTFAIVVDKVDRPPVFTTEDGSVFKDEQAFADQYTFKNQYTGKQFSTQVFARDPDYYDNPVLPINQVIYEIAGVSFVFGDGVLYPGDDIPDGMKINRQTGEITWDIPADFLESARTGSVYLQIIVKEIKDSGQTGLSSTRTINIHLTRYIPDNTSGGPDSKPTDPNEAIMQKLFGEIGASRYSSILQGDLGMFAGLPGRQIIQYVQPIDTGHNSYHGFGGSLRPNGFGIDNTKSSVPASEEKSEEEENSESTTKTEGTPQQKNTSVTSGYLDWIEGVAEEDALDGSEWVRHLAWNLTYPTADDSQWSTDNEEVPDMEGAIALLAAVQ